MVDIRAEKPTLKSVFPMLVLAHPNHILSANHVNAIPLKAVTELYNSHILNANHVIPQCGESERIIGVVIFSALQPSFKRKPCQYQ